MSQTELNVKDLRVVSRKHAHAQIHCTHRLNFRVHIVEVVEDGRLFLVLLNVVPHGQPRDVWSNVQVTVGVL